MEKSKKIQETLKTPGFRCICQHSEDYLLVAQKEKKISKCIQQILVKHLLCFSIFLGTVLSSIHVGVNKTDKKAHIHELALRGNE